MALPIHSQTTSTGSNRVTTYINEVGDTMVSMHYEDARILLDDVLGCEYTDSILTVYKERDSLNTSTITLQKEVLMKMGQEKVNLETMVSKLEEVIKNKDLELGYKDETIKQQKKEIRKQKTLKILGYVGSIVLPIITLLATTL